MCHIVIFYGYICQPYVAVRLGEFSHEGQSPERRYQPSEGREQRGGGGLKEFTRFQSCIKYQFFFYIYSV